MGTHGIDEITAKVPAQLPDNNGPSLGVGGGGWGRRGKVGIVGGVSALQPLQGLFLFLSSRYRGLSLELHQKKKCTNEKRG